MIWIMNLLADRFGSHAILKGGMELRLFDCPRHTNDLDYIFIPYSSKTEIKDAILDALKTDPRVTATCTMNSKCIQYLIGYDALRVQLEVNIALDCASQELTTASLARTQNQQGRIIRGMHLGTALSHKLAAWNERGLIRDLYDVYYLTIMLKVKPDSAILKQRLATIESRLKGVKKKRSMSMTEFISKLETEAKSLTPEMTTSEMRDYLQTGELPGLDRKIVRGIQQIIEYLSR